MARQGKRKFQVPMSQERSRLPSSEILATQHARPTALKTTMVRKQTSIDNICNMTPGTRKKIKQRLARVLTRDAPSGANPDQSSPGIYASFDFSQQSQSLSQLSDRDNMCTSQMFEHNHERESFGKLRNQDVTFDVDFEDDGEVNVTVGVRIKKTTDAEDIDGVGVPVDEADGENADDKNINDHGDVDEDEADDANAETSVSKDTIDDVTIDNADVEKGGAAGVEKSNQGRVSSKNCSVESRKGTGFIVNMFHSESKAYKHKEMRFKPISGTPKKDEAPSTKTTAANGKQTNIAIKTVDNSDELDLELSPRRDIKSGSKMSDDTKTNTGSTSKFFETLNLCATIKAPPDGCTNKNVPVCRVNEIKSKTPDPDSKISTSKEKTATPAVIMPVFPAKGKKQMKAVKPKLDTDTCSNEAKIQEQISNVDQGTKGADSSQRDEGECDQKSKIHNKFKDKVALNNYVNESYGEKCEPKSKTGNNDNTSNQTNVTRIQIRKGNIKKRQRIANKVTKKLQTRIARTALRRSKVTLADSRAVSYQALTEDLDVDEMGDFSLQSVSSLNLPTRKARKSKKRLQIVKEMVLASIFQMHTEIVELQKRRKSQTHDVTEVDIEENTQCYPVDDALKKGHTDQEVVFEE